ncbi:unnamed protein product [Eretmochelys imbricata]
MGRPREWVYSQGAAPKGKGHWGPGETWGPEACRTPACRGYSKVEKRANSQDDSRRCLRGGKSNLLLSFAMDYFPSTPAQICWLAFWGWSHSSSCLPTAWGCGEVTTPSVHCDQRSIRIRAPHWGKMNNNITVEILTCSFLGKKTTPPITKTLLNHRAVKVYSTDVSFFKNDSNIYIISSYTSEVNTPSVLETDLHFSRTIINPSRHG